LLLRHLQEIKHTCQNNPNTIKIKQKQSKTPIKTNQNEIHENKNNKKPQQTKTKQKINHNNKKKLTYFVGMSAQNFKAATQSSVSVYCLHISVQ
jgi:hypothetical protein